MARLLRTVKPTLRGDLHVHSSHRRCHHLAGLILGATPDCYRQGVAEMEALARAVSAEYLAYVNHASDPQRPAHGDRSINSRIIAELQASILFNSRRPKRSAAILAGVEATLLADGQLDVDNGVLSHLDLVLVSRHGGPRLLPARVVYAFCRAMENPNVDVVAVAGSTRFTDAHWEQLFRQAADTKCAIEVALRHGFPTHVLQQLAASNAPVAIGSDLHHGIPSAVTLATGGNLDARRTLAQLLAQGVRPARILNCKSLPALLQWLTRRYV